MHVRNVVDSNINIHCNMLGRGRPAASRRASGKMKALPVVRLYYGRVGSQLVLSERSTRNSYVVRGSLALLYALARERDYIHS